MIIKYGVEKEDILEYCVMNIKNKKMTLHEGVQKLMKHDIEMTEEELAEKL